MISIRGTLAVFRFQLRRAATASRMLWWLVMVAFPISVVSLIYWLDNYVRVANAPDSNPMPEEVWGVVIYALVPCVVCMLGVFLWTAPTVQSEVENRSWTYLAVRPFGKSSLLLGNYLAGIAWTVTAGWLGITVCTLIAQTDERLRLWSTMMALVPLSCFAYGAIYTFLGAAIRKGPMIAAIIYTLLFEVLLGTIPALVNNATIQFRLRSLLSQWLRLEPDVGPWSGNAQFFGQAPAWQHIAILIGIAMAMLLASIWVIGARQIVAADEIEV